MTHNELYQRTRDALEALFEDMSVPSSVIYADLQRLIDDIIIMRVTLDDGSFNPDGPEAEADPRE